MSRKIPAITSRELSALLRKQGFTLDRQSGSHAVFIHPDGRRTTVPIHGKQDIGKGLLRQILKDANLTVADLMNI